MQERRVTAYLLARLDIGSGYPQPRVRCFQITSQPVGSMTTSFGKECYAELLQVSGKTFGEARERLIQVTRDLGWSWLDVWFNEEREAHTARGYLTGAFTPAQPTVDSSPEKDALAHCLRHVQREVKNQEVEATSPDTQGEPTIAVLDRLLLELHDICASYEVESHKGDAKDDPDKEDTSESPLAEEHRQVAAMLALYIDLAWDICESVKGDPETASKDVKRLYRQMEWLKKQRDGVINDPQMRRKAYNASSMLFSLTAPCKES